MHVMICGFLVYEVIGLTLIYNIETLVALVMSAARIIAYAWMMPSRTVDAGKVLNPPGKEIHDFHCLKRVSPKSRAYVHDIKYAFCPLRPQTHF